LIFSRTQTHRCPRAATSSLGQCRARNDSSRSNLFVQGAHPLGAAGKIFKLP